MSGELVGPFPDGADPDAYDRLRRRVLWAFPTGLFVIGSVGELDGARRHNLMTANLVMQVSTDPKVVAVAVETAAVTAALIESGRVFTVSVLKREDRTVVRRFVKPVTDVSLAADGSPSTMAGEPVRVGSTGAPILSAAVAWVECRLHSSVALGSHVVVLGEVVDAGGLEGDGEIEILRMEDTRMNYGG
jgi:3-hydroxy-9,10-secoandrosta-1,3,5(10)-triene-9,17-dione monooxygenase reductase component